MTASDIVSALDLSIFPILGLLVFLALFATLVARALLLSRHDVFIVDDLGFDFVDLRAQVDRVSVLVNRVGVREDRVQRSVSEDITGQRQFPTAL